MLVQQYLHRGELSRGGRLWFFKEGRLWLSKKWGSPFSGLEPTYLDSKTHGQLMGTILWCLNLRSPAAGKNQSLLSSSNAAWLLPAKRLEVGAKQLNSTATRATNELSLPLCPISLQDPLSPIPCGTCSRFTHGVDDKWLHTKALGSK